MPLPMYNGPKHTLAIAAGKGGVGKSTVSANLARALQREGYKVGLLDADLYGPSLRHLLPEDRLPKRDGDTIIPALSQGIELVSMAYFRQEQEAAVVRAPIANGIIKQFLGQVRWSNLDFLLIDFPPGTGDIQLTLSQQGTISGAVMVTTPQDLALLDVRKAIHMFEQVRVPVLGIVENMSYHETEDGKRHYIFGKDGGSKLARECGLPLLGQVPLASEYCDASDNGRSPFESETDTLIKPFLNVAKNTIEHLKSLHSSDTSVLDRFELNWSAK